jgi:hypothetical protein
MRVCVCGGRDYSDRHLLYSVLDDLDLNEVIDVIIEGEASGADKMSRQWAQSRGVPWHPFPAAWDDIDRPGAVVRRTRSGKLYDAAAGNRRNREMLFIGRPDVVLAFPGGTGTLDMMTQTLESGVELRKIWSPLDLS